MAKVNLITVK